MRIGKMQSVVLVSLLSFVAPVTYILMNVQVENTSFLSVDIIVNSESYSIGSDKSADLVELVKNKKGLRGEKASIVLYADAAISYERVEDSIELLKKNGFKRVSLGAK